MRPIPMFCIFTIWKYKYHRGAEEAVYWSWRTTGPIKPVYPRSLLSERPREAIA